MNILQWIFEHKWAITQSALETIIDIVGKNEDLAPETIAKVMHGSIWERYFDAKGNIKSFQALEASDYPILEGSRNLSIAGSTAILPVIGPIFPRANLMTLSGASSVQSLAYDFNLALQENFINTIILNIDSPGGEITGISEFSDMIFKAQAKKQVIAYVMGLGASAAYWIASSASEIILSDTGEVGSIGVVAAYTSRKKEREKHGIEDYEIVSSQSPNKRPDPSTDVGRSQIQATVDQLADVFIAAVARNRGVQAADVLERFGKGGMLVGKSAIESGLADRIGTLEGIIDEFKVKTHNFFIGGSMTLQELKASHPDIYNQAVEIGRKEVEASNTVAIAKAKEDGIAAGVKSENERIKAIEGINVPGAESVVKLHKFDSTKTADAISTLVLQEQKAQMDKMQAGLDKDGNKLANLSLGLSSGKPDAAGQEDAAVLSEMVKGMNGYTKS